MRPVISLFALCSFVVLTGCASIVSDTKYPVTVDSRQEGELTVRNDDGVSFYEGSPPATMTLDASSGFFQPASYTATLETSDETQISQSFGGNLDSWYIGNILLGGVIGMVIIDPATGAMWSLDNTVMINAGPNKPVESDVST